MSDYRLPMRRPEDRIARILGHYHLVTFMDRSDQARCVQTFLLRGMKTPSDLGLSWPDFGRDVTWPSGLIWRGKRIWQISINAL